MVFGWDIRPVFEILPVLLLLVGSVDMWLFLITQQFVLPVFEQLSIFWGYLLNLEPREPEVMMLNAILLHYILMVEVLYGSKHILTVAEWHRFLAFLVSPDLLPDTSQHYLLIFQSNRADKAKGKEQFWHLPASYLDVFSVFFSLVCFAYDAEVHAWSGEVLVETIVHEFIWLSADLDPLNLWLIVNIVFSLLSGLVPVLGVMDQVVDGPIQDSRLVINLGSEAQISFFLGHVSLHRLRFSENSVVLPGEKRVVLSLVFGQLGWDMVGGWVESMLLYVPLLLPSDRVLEVCKFSLLKVDLVGHKLVQCSVGSMVNMGVRVHVGASFSLCEFVILLFFLYSSPHHSALFSISVKSLRCMIWIGCSSSKLGAYSGSVAACVPLYTFQKQ